MEKAESVQMAAQINALNCLPIRGPKRKPKANVGRLPAQAPLILSRSRVSLRPDKATLDSLCDRKGMPAETDQERLVNTRQDKLVQTKQKYWVQDEDRCGKYKLFRSEQTGWHIAEGSAGLMSSVTKAEDDEESNGFRSTPRCVRPPFK